MPSLWVRIPIALLAAWIGISFLLVPIHLFIPPDSRGIATAWGVVAYPFVVYQLAKRWPFGDTPTD